MTHQLVNEAKANSESAGSRSTGYKPPPKSLESFPNAKVAPRKTPVQGGGGLRKRWKDPKGNIYEWDSQHGAVEKYNKNGKHLGEYDSVTGEQTKPADGTRKVEK
ncbi:colicin E3/pyocin S6 family cytotoxin [Streptomyces sp. NBC_00624]|uniref:colicin E3/pyocin S6 family cytotoxin n=1 Tax=Streptomyces sp. NBC_00624 TaxID=2975791 RepID=UPI0030E272F0